MSLVRASFPRFLGYNFDRLSYTGNSLTVDGTSLAWRPDGARVLILDGKTVRIYDLSTAWDISTANTNGTISLSLFGTTSDTKSLRLSDDGLKLFVLASDGEIKSFDLSTAYGGTSSYVDRLIGSEPLDAFTITDDGTRIIAHTNGEFRDNELTTAWDLDTDDGWSNALRDASLSFPDVKGFTLAKDGTQIVFCQNDPPGGGGDDRVRGNELSVPNDIQSWSFLLDNFIGDVSTDGGGDPLDVAYSADGSNLYVMATDTVLQYRTVG